MSVVMSASTEMSFLRHADHSGTTRAFPASTEKSLPETREWFPIACGFVNVPFHIYYTHCVHA